MKGWLFREYKLSVNDIEPIYPQQGALLGIVFRLAPHNPVSFGVKYFIC
jgi:hypothetical protein